jgi:hypothetical protein
MRGQDATAVWVLASATGSTATLALALLGAACSDDSAHAGVYVPRTFPVPGCEQFDSRPCNALLRHCQTRLYGLAACLRGEEPGELPPISVISPEDYGDALREYYAENPLEGPGSFEHTLALLGLSDEGSFSIDERVARAEESVWGVYVDETREILLIDHGVGFGEAEVDSVLVHEFVHVLQDRAVGVAPFYEAYGRTWDSALAAGAVIEGEADFVRYRYLVAALGYDPRRVDYVDLHESTVEESWRALVESTDALAASQMFFAYAWGSRYMNYVFEEGGFVALGARWTSPPSTTYEFIASQFGAVAPNFEPVEFDAPEPPEGVTADSGTVLGAWGLLVLLAKQGLTLQQATSRALDWRGDGYFTYVSETGASAAVWRIELADQRAAADLAERLAGPTLRAETVGTTLTLGVADPELPMDWVFEP